MRVRLLCEGTEKVGVAVSIRIGLARSIEPFRCEFADRFQHPEPIAGVADEALINQRLQAVEFRIDDLLRGIKAAAAPERGEPGEQLLFLVAEEFITPFDGRSER